MSPQLPASRPEPGPDGASAEGASTASRWDAARALFDRLQPLGPAAREAALADPGIDAVLRDELRTLLAADAAADADAEGGFLAEPVLHRMAPPQRPAAQAGQRVGAWRLLGLLGRGGMGEVWLAERDDGAWRGEAAVKLLREELAGHDVMARFALERQALARLSHPHIARLLDAGHTPEGRPFVVMERVRGQTIDRACEGRSLAERLALFLQLADAVAHAHRKLLLHRDLKPSNVLVDEAGDVKLLDFGIAKALAGDAGPGFTGLSRTASEATRLGQRAFSPLYASPEHLRGEPVGVASDVFSLGVLLSEMLTGRRPHGEGAASALAAAHAVLEDAPSPPSALFEPGRPATQGLTRQALLGDIDAIVLRALEKLPERRYASVEALAADLQAHLAGAPVVARAPGPAERLLRRLRGQPLVALAIALALLGLAGGLAAAWLQERAALALGLAVGAAGLGLAAVAARRARAAEAQATRHQAELRQLARGLVFGHHDRIAMLAGSTEARDRLLADAVRALDPLSHPAAGPLEPMLARELAETYLRVAVLQGEGFSPSQERLADAEANLDKALALLPRYLDDGPQSPDALNAAVDMWLARTTQRARRGRLGAALAALEQARALAERAQAAAPQDLQALSRAATVQGRVGILLGNQLSMAHLGRLDEAREPLERCLQGMRALVAAEPDQAEWLHQCAWAGQQRAQLHWLCGEWEAAVAGARQAVDLRDAASAMKPHDAHLRHQRASVRSLLGQTLASAGRVDEGRQAMQEAGRIVRATVDADPANRTAARDVVMFDVAEARLDAADALGRGDAALRQRTLQRLRGLLGAMPESAEGEDYYLARWRAELRLWLARLLPGDRGQPDPDGTGSDQALRLLREARALLQGDDDNASRRWGLALVLGETARRHAVQGDAVAASAAARAALGEWQAVPAGRPPVVLASWAGHLPDLAATGRLPDLAATGRLPDLAATGRLPGSG